jgi:HSP20 family protein
VSPLRELEREEDTQMQDKVTVVQNGETSAASTDAAVCEYSPRIDVLELPEEFRLEAELPGVAAGDVDVDLENGILTIQGRIQPRNDRGQVRFREFGSGNFVRSLKISDSIDSGRITAEMKNGLLTLHLPKVGTLKPRSIPVVSGN